MLNTTELYKEAIIKSNRQSEASIYFGIFDVTAKEDANPVITDIQSFTTVESIVDNVRKPLYKLATLEENNFKLDGSFKSMPKDITGEDYMLGWWSLSQSGLDRTFVENPIISISFGDLHSSMGIELFFDDLSVCEAFRVTWFNSNSIINEEFIEGNKEKRYFIDTTVENYNKVVIELVRTSQPFRYARINEVNFGGEEVFGPDKLMSATIVEEIDPITSSIGMNKLTFTVSNEGQKFNMINPEGVYGLLQRRQQITAEVSVSLGNGEVETIDMGMYYLSSWKNSTGLTATLEATDVIGLLDRTTYQSSPFWVNEPLGNVVKHILEDAGKFNVYISPDLMDEKVNGYIPIVSHREALSAAVMAVRGTVRKGRLGNIEIIKVDYSSEPKKEVGYDLILGDPTIEQKSLITTVEAKEYSFSLGQTPESIHQSTFTLQGTETIMIPFNKAATDVIVEVSGSGELIENTNSAVSSEIVVQGWGSITISITGKVYKESTKTVKSRISEIPAGQVPQTATISENKLFTRENTSLVTQHILDYYQKRVRQTFNYWNDPSLEAGDKISVETMFGNNYSGVIERQSVELSPSLKSILEVIG